MRSLASAWRRPRPRPTRAGLPLYRYVGGVEANLLPVPMMNIFNGGVHADNAHRLPGIHGDAGRRADNFAEALRCGAEIFHALKSGAASGGPVDRGRRRRRLRARRSNRRAKASTSSRKRSSAAGYTLGDDVLLALDCAASEYFKDGAYGMEGEGKTLSPAENGRLTSPSLPPIIRSPRSRTAWPRTIGTGWKQLTEQDRRPSPAGRRRSVRHQCEAAARGH